MFRYSCFGFFQIALSQFGRRIKTTAAPRIAPCDAPGSKPDSDNYTVIFNRLRRVFATAWIIPAKPVRVKPFKNSMVRAYGFLVDSDRSRGKAAWKFAHFSASCLILLKSASREDLFAITAMSRGAPRYSAKAALTRRLTRFLWTAPGRVFLEIITANLEGSLSRRAKILARKKAPCQLFPLSKALLICRDAFI